MLDCERRAIAFVRQVGAASLPREWPHPIARRRLPLRSRSDLPASAPSAAAIRLLRASFDRRPGRQRHASDGNLTLGARA